MSCERICENYAAHSRRDRLFTEFCAKPTQHPDMENVMRIVTAEVTERVTAILQAGKCIRYREGRFYISGNTYPTLIEAIMAE